MRRRAALAAILILASAITVLPGDNPTFARTALNIGQSEIRLPWAAEYILIGDPSVNHYGRSTLPPEEDEWVTCRPLLPFGNIGISPSSVSGLSLRLQIVGIVLLGTLLAFSGALGIFLILDNPNRYRKAFGGGLAVVSFPLTLTLFGWGFLGHPGVIWGLCG